MRAILVLTALVSAIGLAPKSVSAHSFKVALVASVSGPKAGPGKHARDGFMLATTERDSHPDQESDGHLGGLDVYVTLIDPLHSPATARAAIRTLIGKGGIDFVVAGDDPKVLEAIHPLVTGSAIFLIGTGPSPTTLAGAKCNPFFFSVSWPRDREKTENPESGRPFVAQWANNLDNLANKAFVAAFEKTYGYPPTPYAAMGYEATIWTTLQTRHLLQHSKRPTATHPRPTRRWGMKRPGLLPRRCGHAVTRLPIERPCAQRCAGPTSVRSGEVSSSITTNFRFRTGSRSA